VADRLPLPPVTLRGSHVRLEPLALEHVDGLTAAASVDRSTYEWTSVPDGRPAMQRYVAGLLAEQAAGQVLPFAQRAAGTGALLGCTRYMELRWFAGRELPDEVEVGGTWLSGPAQRTGVNTEAKLLLFQHAFEEIGAWRITLATDANNARSRAAIERVGATFEGILRNHRALIGDRVAPGTPPTPRDTAVFSITRDEWPAARAGLLAKLAAY
jgi:RimJ/RimL family protein N-acetyltransferase